MSIEEQRVASEQARDASRRASLERARAEALAREHREALLRAHEEEERHKAEASRRRQEQAEQEALKIAAIERIRVEAAEREKLQTLALSQTHERELFALQNDVEKRRLRRTIVTIVIASIVVVGAALGMYFGKIRPDALLHQSELAADAERNRAEAARLETEARDRDERLQKLERERASNVVDAPILPTPQPKPAPPRAQPRIVLKEKCHKGANPLDPLNECL